MQFVHVPRLLRTLRYLRPSQWYWRAVYQFERRCRLGTRTLPRIGETRPQIRSGDFPAIPVLHRSAAHGDEALALLDRGEFRLLDQSKCLGRGPTNWLVDNPTVDRLWTITLHYHEWVYSLAELANQGRDAASLLLDEYLADWQETCDPARIGTSNLVWNSYAMATRLSWWIRSLALDHCNPAAEWRQRLFAEIPRHADFITRHIEWDLRANHVLRDAVGLAWAGRFFGGASGDRWLRQATEISVKQVEEQILPDGGHFERSPMYHLHIMEDVLSLASLLTDARAAAQMRSAWRRMAECAAWLRHPDGEIPQLNDASRRGACEPGDMLACGGLLNVPCSQEPRRGGMHLADFGAVVWHGNPWSLFFDIGPIGPDYQPGHAHADSLTVDVSYRGQRLFVDPGSFSYDKDERRAYDRATDSHNTVCVDGRDSSEVWHIFRVGRRARPRNVRVVEDPGGIHATASHDGYAYLPGRPIHTRRISVGDGRGLEIRDRVTGRRDHSIAGGLLLDPAWRAEPAAAGWDLRRGLDVVQVRVQSDRAVQLSIENRKVHPSHGVELDTQRLTWRFQGALPFEILVRVDAST